MNKYLKVFLLGICAGAAIGLGGLLFVICSAYDLRLLGSFLFGIGLFLVCTLGLFLYTGKIGFLITSENKKEYSLNLFIGYIGNIVGAVGFGYLMFLAFRNVDTIFTKAIAVSASRNTDIGNGGTPFYKELLTGFLCGIYVFLAVYFFKKKWNIFIRILILLFCVFSFVASGFEHCIANMFYVSMANGWNGQTILNIVIITFANSIGSILLMTIFKLVKIEK